MFLSNLFFRRKEENYEKLLGDLEEKQKESKNRIKQINQREVQILTSWTFRNCLVYFLYMVGIAVIHFLDADVGLTKFGWYLFLRAPMIMVPLFIHFSRKFIKAYYRNRRQRETKFLEQIEKRHQLSIEEMKAKTGYNDINKLVEKYEKKDKPIPKVEENPFIIPENTHKLPERAPNPVQHFPESTPQKIIQQPSPNFSSNTQQPKVLTSRSLQQQLSTPNSRTYSVDSPSPQMKSTWYDKVMITLLGQDGPQNQYALICKFCFTHNGLVLPEEIQNIKFRCFQCHSLNSKDGLLTGNNLAALSSTPSPLPDIKYHPIGVVPKIEEGLEENMDVEDEAPKAVEEKITREVDEETDGGARNHVEESNEVKSKLVSDKEEGKKKESKKNI